MNCQEARTRWHARLDQGTADAELLEHLAHCPGCRLYDSQMRELLGALDELRVASEREVMAGEASNPRARPQLPLPASLLIRRRILRVAAAIALLVAGALYFGDRFHPDRLDRVLLSTEAGTESFTASLRLTGESAEDYLAVSVPTSRADVQMFWLYPTLGGMTDGAGSQVGDGRFYQRRE